MDRFYSSPEEHIHLLETLVEYSNEGYWIWDMEDKSYEYLSPRFKEILGYDVDEMEHSPDGWMKMIDPEDLKVAIKNFEMHLADKNHPYNQVVRYTHRLGHDVWVICKGHVVYNEDGSPKMVVGVHTDITKLKEIEIQLHEEVVKATNAFSAKNIFLASMSHEIRTPMNGIMGYLQILQLKDKDPEMIKLVESTLSCARTLSMLLNDILEYSKFDAETISLNRTSFDVRKLVRESMKKYETDTLVIRNHVSKSVPEFILEDELRFNQIYNNLVSNAVKYTPSGGTVTAKVYVKKEFLYILVRDTGIGIPQEHVGHIFEPFYRVSTTTSIQGTGLGLSVCGKLCELMGGSIKCKSKIGKGSTFKVRLPLVRSDNTTPKTKLSIPNVMEDLGIILAEDDKNNVSVFVQILDLLGYSSVDVVPNGKELVKAVKKKEYDIIFTDDRMPIMNGLEAAQKIKTIFPDAYIVAITANSIYGDKERYLKVMDDYISKPIAIELLVKVFERFERR